MSVNKVILIGNVGKDPEVRYLDTGIAVASFPLATTDRAYTLLPSFLWPLRRKDTLCRMVRRFRTVPNGIT